MGLQRLNWFSSSVIEPDPPLLDILQRMLVISNDGNVGLDDSSGSIIH